MAMIQKVKPLFNSKVKQKYPSLYEEQVTSGLVSKKREEKGDGYILNNM